MCLRMSPFILVLSFKFGFDIGDHRTIIIGVNTISFVRESLVNVSIPKGVRIQS